MKLTVWKLFIGASTSPPILGSSCFVFGFFPLCLHWHIISDHLNFPASIERNILITQGKDKTIQRGKKIWYNSVIIMRTEDGMVSIIYPRCWCNNFIHLWNQHLDAWNPESVGKKCTILFEFFVYIVFFFPMPKKIIGNFSQISRKQTKMKEETTATLKAINKDSLTNSFLFKLKWPLPIPNQNKFQWTCLRC